MEATARAAAATTTRYRRKWFYLGVPALVLLVALVAGYPWIKEQIAYVRGLQAYLYGLPLVMTDVSNDVMTATSKAGDFRAPINQFWRMRTFVPADYEGHRTGQP